MVLSMDAVFVGRGGTGFSPWETEEDARLAPEHSAAVRGPRPVTLETDQVYEVRHTWSDRSLTPRTTMTNTEISMNAKPAGAPAGPVEEAAAEPAASSLLGSAEFLDGVLVAVVSDVLGHPARPKDWTVLPAGYEARSISTGALLRIRGTTHEEEPWSIFVKILQSPRHWPLIDVIPPELRQGVIDTFPWRDEADVLRSDLPDRLPPGLRTPRLLRVDDLGDDRLAMWLEDITPADTPWDLERFIRAARLLGRWAGRRRGDATSAEMRAGTGNFLREFLAGPLTTMAFLRLRDDGLWAHPLVAGAADPMLRADLLTLAVRVPAILDRLDALPQTVGHGDACPQNLLVPADAPDTFVAIDISWQHPHPIGFDLGQLLVGLTDTGTLRPQDLPAIHAALIPAYRAGLLDEGYDADPADITYGFDASMVVRSCFMVVPFERLAEPVTAELQETLAQRLSLTRYLADIGLNLAAR
jgi:hypothetical protein